MAIISTTNLINTSNPTIDYIPTGMFYYQLDLSDDLIEEITSELIPMCIESNIHCITDNNDTVIIAHNDQSKLETFILQALCHGDNDIFEEYYGNITFMVK